MADKTVLMGLGRYRFSTSAPNYQKLERTFEFRWEPQMRIGRRPAMQFLGPGVETIMLDGVIYPHYHGGLAQVERMRREGELGRAYGLSSGFGRYFGRFVIVSVRDIQSYFLSNGAPRKIEFAIELAHYG